MPDEPGNDTPAPRGNGRFSGTGRLLFLTLLAVVAGYFAATWLARAWRADAEVKRDFEVMRTYARITIPAKSGASMPHDELAALAERAVREINDLMGPVGDKSDVRRLNAAPAGTWVEVSPLTWRVVMEALRWNRLTGGAFDPTIGPVKALFAFDKGDHESWPDAAELAAAKDRVGADKLRFEREGMRLAWAKDGMRLDLGAIAKGFAADRAVEVLKANGVRHAMVDIGGELRMLGGKPGTPPTPWRTGVRNPLWDSRREGPDAEAPLVENIPLTDAAVATSGDYENYFIHQGKRYSHFIDPRAGLPLTVGPGTVAGATVVSPDSCLAADALATSLCVMGPDAAREFFEEQALGLFSKGVKAILLIHGDKDGELRKITFVVDGKGGVTVDETAFPENGRDH